MEWRQAEYVINVDSLSQPGLRNIAKERYRSSFWFCKSRSSTIALASFLYSFTDGIKVLIFGLDSLTDPGRCGNSLRECAKARYREHLESFIKESKCNDVECRLPMDTIEFVITPAMGSFHGYSFKGGPVHIFNIAFSRILRAIEEFEPSFIVVDITHGINYQTVSVFYSAIAAAILMNKERALTLFNSEPYPRVGRQERHQEQLKQQAIPQLGLLDVTDIAKVFEFIRLVTGIPRLRSVPLKELIEGKEILGQDFQKRLLRLATIVKLLENAAVGLTYPGAVDENGSSLKLDACTIPIEGDCQAVDYIPYVKDENIMYDRALVAIVMTCALNRVVKQMQNSLCRGRAGERLIEYLSLVGDKLGEVRLRYVELVVKRELEKWSSAEKLITKLVTECRNDFAKLKNVESGARDVGARHPIIIGNGVVEVESDLIRVLIEMKQRDIMKECKELVSIIDRTIAEVLKKKLNERNAKRIEIRDEDVRNMCAHAGLSYSFIEKIVLVQDQSLYRVTQVVFNKEKVKMFLEKIEKHLSQVLK